jgi:uncharacterized protein (TIGR03083 family)
MDVSEHVAALDIAGRRFAAVVAGTNLNTAVPPCPGWDVRDLVRHLGGVHRWATLYVSEARTAMIDLELEELVGGWPSDSDLVDWFVVGHGRLVECLAAAPADLDCFTFLAAPSPLAMWARRQAHETSIHRIDAESAANTLTPFPRDLALDGIDEVLTALITRRGRGPRSPVERRIQFSPEDSPERWTVWFNSESCRTERSGTAADVTASGAASDLYAWVWNRPSIGKVTIAGDATVAGLWQQTAHGRKS